MEATGPGNGDLEYTSPDPEALMDSHQNIPSAPPTVPEIPEVNPNRDENPFVVNQQPNQNFQDPEPPSYMSNSRESASVYHGGDAEDDVYRIENPLHTRNHTIACLAVASLILLFASSIECKSSTSGHGCSGSHAFAVAVAFVSLVFSIFYLIHAYKDVLRFLPERSNLYFAIFFFFWWIIAVFVLTMDSPFPEPSNGYFAIWSAFICSCSLLHRETQYFRTLLGYALNVYDRSKPLAVVLFASIICMLAAIPPCANTECKGDEAFAVVLAVISIIICILLFVMQESIGNFAGYLIGFLCLWWLFGVLICSFQGPFAAENGAITSANGFFSTWVALFSSAWMLASAKKGDAN